MMKFKRFVAIVLLVGILCSFAVPMTFAEANDTICYDFQLYNNSLFSDTITGAGDKFSKTSIKSAIENAYADGTLNWKLETTADGYDPTYMRFFSNNAEGLRLTRCTGVWVAFRVVVPQAGNYEVSIKNNNATYGYQATVFAIAAPAETMTADGVATTIGEEYLIGYTNGNTVAVAGEWAFSAGEYILVIGLDADRAAIAEINLTPIQDEQEETTVPEETTAPWEPTYAPTETTMMPEETTAPTETTTPAETTIHEETTEATQPDESIVASGIFGDDLTWTLDEEGTLTISGTGSMGYWYNAIGAPWNNYRKAIKEVIIEYGVTGISEYAFYNCVNLKSVIIPESVTVFSNYAFSNCSSLTSVMIPDGVTSIGSNAFSYCNNLTNVTLPEGVVSIGEYAFYNCYRLTSITIPESVVSIGYDAFSYCDGLSNITIPENVTYIGDNAFRRCNSLNGIWVDDNNPNYSSDSCGVFFNKDKTTLIQAPGGLRGDYAIPDSVTSIGNYAFYDCNSLTSVTVGNSIVSIGYNAFYSCSSLQSITIPDGVTSIGDGAFRYCSSLTGIWVDENNAYYSSDSYGVLYNKDKTTLLQAPGANIGAYTIPDSVTLIGVSAFEYCSNLTSVNIPDSVQNIGSCAFQYCSSLTSIIIPKNIAGIGMGAFGASGLKTAYLEGTADQWTSVNLGYVFNSSTSIVYLDDAPALESLTFTPVSVKEATNGSWNGDVFLYNITTLLGNSTYTATFTDGTVLTGSGTGFNYDGLWYEFPKTAEQSQDHPWLGGNTYNITVSLLGQTVQVPVTIEASPLVSLEFTPASVVEGTCGYWNGSYYYYHGSNICGRAAYTATFSDGTVLKGSSSGFNYNGTWYSFDYTMPNQNYENQLTVGNTYSMTVSVMGKRVEVPFTIVPSPLVKLEFTPASVIEGTCGNLQSAYNPETGAYDLYYHYYDGSYICSRATYTATFSDGTVLTGNSSGFNYNDTWYSFDCTMPNQNYENQLTVGNTYSMTVSVMGQRVEVPFTIVPSPLVSLEFTPVSVIEGTCGYWSWSDNQRYYYYSESSIRSNSTYTATFSDGTVLTGNSSGFNYNDTWYSFDCTMPNQNYENQLTVGNTYSMTVSVLGKQAEMPFTIVPSPLVSLEFTPVYIAKETTGYWNDVYNPETDTYDLQYFYYSSWEIRQKSTYTATFSDGTVLTDNAYDGITYNGQYYSFDCQSPSQGYENQWLPGNTYDITMTVLGQTAQLPVTICEPVYSGGYGYIDCNGEAEIVDCTLTDAVLQIPETIDGLPVVRIESIGAAIDTAQEVIIPNSVRTLANNVFRGSTSLERVTIPASVTTIGNRAFYKCTNLQSVTIPESVTSIGYYAFEYCSSLTEIVIPESVTNIGSEAFSDCTGLQRVVILGNLTSIGYEAFSYCTSLTDVTIGDGVTYIGSSMFSGCSSLRNISIPDSVTKIEYGAFSGCSSLQSIDIPSGVTSIGSYAFSSCTSLESIVIPDGVNLIQGYVFNNCTSLKNITLSDNITNIGYYAFDNCTSLESITIPASVIGISEGYAFRNCTSLTGIWVDPENESYCSDSYGVLYNKSMTTLMQMPGAIEGDYFIPESVTTISPYALSGCKNLTAIWVDENNPNFSSDSRGVLFNKDMTLLRQAPGGISGNYTVPDSVETISEKAFQNCAGLTGVEIPGSVRYIESAIFSGCSNLEWITLPFLGASAEPGGCLGQIFGRVSYPGSMEADGWQIPSSLKTVTLNGDRPGNGSFQDCSGIQNIYLSDDSTAIGAYSFAGCTGLKELIIPEGVTVIGRNAFAGCSRLKELIIPDSVTSIYWGAFQNCTGLTGLEIPDSVISIDDSILSGCSNLEWVTVPNVENYLGYYFGAYDYPESIVDAMGYYIPASLKTVTVSGGDVGYGAFWGCSGIESITLKDAVTSIGDYAFYNCKSLSSIKLSDSITTIGESTFSDCYNLKHIVIPEGVTSIGWGAFWDCTGLEQITLPDSLTTIGDYAFVNCYALQSIQIPNGVTTVGESTFSDCYSLKSVAFPEGMTCIGWGSFWDCTGLQSITIPTSVDTIKAYAFKNCEKLTDVYYVGTQEQWEQVTIIDENAELYAANITYASCEHSYVQNGACAVCGEDIGSIITDSQGNKQMFVSFQDALEAATAGQTIVMTSDGEVSELVLPGGVTLDLNGNELAVVSVLTFSSNAIIDTSADVSGLLKISDFDGNMISPDNSSLPVYDKENGGLRFFEIDVISKAVTGKKFGNPKYWFKVDVTKFDRFNELVQADSKVQIKVKMTWDGQSAPAYALANLAFTRDWADSYRANSDVYVTVTVSEADAYENLVLTPCIAANGVEISGEEME